MIAKILDQGHGFKGLLRYVFGHGKDPENQPYSFYDSGNMSSNDRRDFAINMITLDRNAERLKQEAGIPAGRKKKNGSVFHAVMSWLDGEKPNEEHQKQAARELLEKWGLDQNQYVIVGHNDTDNAHMHLVVNLTDPENGMRAKLDHSKTKGLSFAKDYRKAHGWNVQPEQQYGAKPENTQQATPKNTTALAPDAPAKNAPEFKEEHQPAKIIEKIQARHAAFTRENIERELYADIPHREQRRAIVENTLKSDLLKTIGERDGQAVFSTQAMIDFEKGMIETAQAMHQSNTHAIDQKHRDAALLGVREGVQLSPQQREAIEHLTNDSQLSNLIGFAGAGKSTILKVAADAWEAQGFRVRGGALSGIAAQNMQENGIISETLHGFEGKNRRADEMIEDMQGRPLSPKQAAFINDAKLTQKDVFIVDEAAMVSASQLNNILEMGKKSGAKIVMVGDHNQLQSIDAGAAFRTIVERTEAAQLDEVRRQREEWQKQATIDLANGKTAEGLAPYIERGHVKTLKTHDDVQHALTSDYMAAYEADPSKSRMALAYTRRDVQALNNILRGEMKKRGVVHGEDHTTTILRDDGKGGFFKAKENFAAGDRLMFRANDKGLGVMNGSLATIKAIEQGRFDVVLDNGQALSFNQEKYQKFQLGYSATVHKAQGCTVDESFIMASQHLDRQAAYVALSRHKDDTRLYAAQDDFKKTTLLKALSKDRANLSTLDFENSPQMQRGKSEAQQPNVKAAPVKMTPEQQERLHRDRQKDTTRRVEDFEELASDPMQDVPRWLESFGQYGEGRTRNNHFLPLKSGRSPKQSSTLRPLDTAKNGQDTRKDIARPDHGATPETLNIEPMQQDKPPMKRSKKDITDFITEAFNTSENGEAFRIALDKQGFTLAPATSGGFAFVDETGKINVLSRFLDTEERGQPKKKIMQAKFADLDRDTLGNVDDIAAARRNDQGQGITPEPKPELKISLPKQKQTEEEEMRILLAKKKFEEEYGAAFAAEDAKKQAIADELEDSWQALQDEDKAKKSDKGEKITPRDELAAIFAKLEAQQPADNAASLANVKGTNAVERAKEKAAALREQAKIENEKPAIEIAPEPAPIHTPEVTPAPETEQESKFSAFLGFVGDAWNSWREDRADKRADRAQMQQDDFKTAETAPSIDYEAARAEYKAAIDPTRDFSASSTPDNDKGQQIERTHSHNGANANIGTATHDHE